MKKQSILGSSPLARGKVPSGSTFNGKPRIIPACAGKSYTAKNNNEGNNGSSPLARGKVETLFKNSANVGIIPACAGKSR